MWQYHQFFNKRPAFDITVALKNLLAVGCSEREIADFARLRARYASIADHSRDYPVELDSKEKSKLAFYRYLVQTGRLVS